jgi:hypothetical protein
VDRLGLSHMRLSQRIARFLVLMLAAILSQSIAVSSSDTPFLPNNPRAKEMRDLVPLLILYGGGRALSGIALVRP